MANGGISAVTNLSFNGGWLGCWNASTNIPCLSDSRANVYAGKFYTVSVDGTQDLGGGSQYFPKNSIIISNSMGWVNGSGNLFAGAGAVFGYRETDCDTQVMLEDQTITCTASASVLLYAAALSKGAKITVKNIGQESSLVLPYQNQLIDGIQQFITLQSGSCVDVMSNGLDGWVITGMFRGA
jgi:hypothetical protein